MRRPWKLRRDLTDVDAIVRSARPEPREEFVREQATRLRAQQEPRGLGSRLAPAAGLTAVFVGALAWVGGLGYVASGAQQAIKAVTSAVSSSDSTVLSSPSTDQYRPGKGCGDRNHVHERKFQCKVDISDASVKEGNSGQTSMVFTISLSDVALDRVVIVYSTIGGGTATAGSDYLPVAGATLSIPAGASGATVTVQVIGDTLVEPNETLLVNIDSVSDNAYIGDGQGLGTIFNDDR
jgi:hypothetical protein